MNKTLDVRGMDCPRPTVMIINTLRKMNSGEILRVIGNDQTTKRMIPSLCERLGFKLVGLKEGGEFFQYFIEK
ncbi:MAG TPA: sulfurtransferase TusA family protein [Nitrospirae bacterium]|nr:sulfurtransferase TusA family protein [Nitrospirota bacterium]